MTRGPFDRILADTIVLYDLYQNCRWVVRGEGQHLLERVLDQHAMEQLELVDLIIESIETLGGTATTDPRRVAEVTAVGYLTDVDDEVPALLHRLLDAHEVIFDNMLQRMKASAVGSSDCGNDPILEGVLRCHQQQARVIASLLPAHGPRPTRFDPH